MVKKIKQEVKRFAEHIEALADERERRKAENNARYLPDVAAVENEKLQEMFETEAEPIRARTIAAVETVIQKMKNFIISGITHVNVQGISEIRALDGIELEDFEVDIIRESVRGDYWCLRVLADRVSKSEDTAEGILANSQSFRPQPEKYFALFDELMETTKKIIKGYDGQYSTNSTSPEVVESVLLLQGTHFEDAEERLNMINQFYFHCDNVKFSLTPEEEAQLLEFLGACRESEIELKLHSLYASGKIPADSDIYDILSRSRYRKIFAHVVDSFMGENPVELMARIEESRRAKEAWEKKFADMFKFK